MIGSYWNTDRTSHLVAVLAAASYLQGWCWWHFPSHPGKRNTFSRFTDNTHTHFTCSVAQENVRKQQEESQEIRHKTRVCVANGQQLPKNAAKTHGEYLVWLGCILVMFISIDLDSTQKLSGATWFFCNDKWSLIYFSCILVVERWSARHWIMWHPRWHFYEQKSSMNTGKNHQTISQILSLMFSDQRLFQGHIT